MNSVTPIRKIFEGVATRPQMFRLFTRHNQRPGRWQTDMGHFYSGEWFEIDETLYDYMLDILPPLWMRGPIFALRESHLVRSMSRGERLEHIWSSTADVYRGYAGERFPPAMQGQRTVMLWSSVNGTILKLLNDLTDDEIAAKLPVHMRHLPTIAA